MTNERVQYLNEIEMAQYLNENYGEHFKKKVTPHDVKRWIDQKRITEFTESGLDNDMHTKKLPPKRGRPSRYTECDRQDIIAACEYMTRGDVAKKFGCSQSYVSLIARGKR